MADINEKERKCIRFLAGEISLEDRMMFQIELELDREMKSLYQDIKETWELYPTDLETPAYETRIAVTIHPFSGKQALINNFW